MAKLKESHSEVFFKIRKRFNNSLSWESDNRIEALDDIAIRKGDQWPAGVKKQREEDGRPCLTFNRSEGFIDQVVGDARQNRIEIKVTSDDAPLAPIYEALVSQIQYKSKAHIAYNTALDHAAGHGFGYIRVGTRYLPNSFDQECYIQRITNPFTVYIDPSAKELTKFDMRYAFVSIYMPRDEFEDKYPNADSSLPPQGSGESYEKWFGDEVRVAEYFEKRTEKKKIVLLKDGSVVDYQKAIPKEIILNEREEEVHTIWRSLINGTDYLEEPVKIPGKYIPIIPVYGKELHDEGKTIYRGVIRHAKDAQRAYNYHRTASAESVGLAPKAPWLATGDQVEGYETIWQTANTKNHSYLPYNHKAGQPIPQRVQPAGVASGAVNEAAMAAEDLKATTGIYDASLGAKGNETSGKAILARQREGDTATFAYHDNLAIAVEQTGRVIVSMIPEVYDGQRNIKIRAEDEGVEKEIDKRVNVRLPDGGVENDLTKGTYDVVVTTGPSYATQRIEALDSLMQLVQVSPEVRTRAMDKVFENMDFKGADEIAARLRPPDPNNPPPPSPEQQVEMESLKADQKKSEATIAKANADMAQAQFDLASIGMTTESQ